MSCDTSRCLAVRQRDTRESARAADRRRSARPFRQNSLCLTETPAHGLSDGCLRTSARNPDGCDRWALATRVRSECIYRRRQALLICYGPRYRPLFKTELRDENETEMSATIIPPGEPLLEQVEQFRKRANSEIEPSTRSNLGQFMTPGAVSQLVAGML